MMSDDNPFASDPTVIRPNPGGRRPAAGPGPAVPGPGTVQGQGPAAVQGPTPPSPPSGAPLASHPGVPGLGPLIAAAGPLLSLAGWLRLLPAHQNVPGLRQRLLGELQTFDSVARKSGQSELAVRQADYILCATLDDVVANTPWGMAADWSRQSLARTRHNDATGGEQVFRLLEEYRQDPGNQIAGIELLYFCLSLGFEGRLRISQQGGAEMVRLRENLHRLLRQYRGERERELSPNWRGVEGGKGLRFSLPLWAVAAAAALIVTAGYFGFSYKLNELSDHAFTEIATLPPSGAAQAPVPAAAPAVTGPVTATPEQPPPLDVDRVSGFLKPEIEQHLVTVFDDGHNTVVRIVGAGMFASGSATVESPFLPLLGKIAEALKDTHGTVLVTGHTDNQPIHSLKFPSNFDLSTARAKAVLDIIAAKVPEVAPRLGSEGRADTQPVAPNTTPDGRQRNRRIDVIVPRPLETVQ
ncbi:MAG: type VI secretion system protein TssL, long form [Aliidongia sp.]